MIKNILVWVFGLLPEGSLKNKIRCYYSSLWPKNQLPAVSVLDVPRHLLNIGPNHHGLHVRASYDGNCFQLRFANGVIIRSYYDIFWIDIAALQGYLAKYKLKEGDNVVDCGAYYGLFTIYAAKVIGNNGLVIAFEPDDLNYQKMVSNIKLNALTNVIAVNKGVWSKNTLLHFNNKHEEDSSFFFDGTSESIIDVRAVSIDSELGMIGISKVNFLKMDIEGSELEAIKGAEETLKNNYIHLAIASYHIINGQASFNELERLLTTFNYEAITSFPKHLTTYAAKLK